MSRGIFVLAILLVLGQVLTLGIQYQNILQGHVKAPVDKWIDTGCNCYKYSCGCCVHLEVPKIHLNDTGCVNFTYIPKDYGISFIFTIDNLTIYNETISAHEPPPICFHAPIIEEFADLCVHFYDLNATWHMLHGCVQVEARLHHVVLASYKVGCFTIGHNSTLVAGTMSRKINGRTYIPKISKYQISYQESGILNAWWLWNAALYRQHIQVNIYSVIAEDMIGCKDKMIVEAIKPKSKRQGKDRTVLI